MSVAVGQPAPEFSLPDQERNAVSLDSLKGSKSLVVFIPFPFSGICTDELCMIRDDLSSLDDLDAKVVAITCDTLFSNKKWSEDLGLGFPVLADYWPHGEVSKAFGAFNEDVGAANRYTFVLDADGVVREVINTESLGVAREHEAYAEALASI